MATCVARDYNHLIWSCDRQLIIDGITQNNQHLAKFVEVWDEYKEIWQINKVMSNSKTCTIIFSRLVES